LDLNLNSHSTTLDLESSQANGAASTVVRCRRCLSSSHSRRACTTPIKLGYLSEHVSLITNQCPTSLS
jgi:hypothetical protein